MSGIQHQISDQTNQAIALLGGATAQSYNVVSLNVSPATLDLQHADADLSSSELTEKSPGIHSEAASLSLEKLFVDTSAPLPTARPLPLSASEELNESSSGFVEPEVQNPELMSRFEGSSLDDEGSLGILQAGVLATTLGSDESAETMSTGSMTFSLLDFIEQAIAQAEASQQEFGETFDGSRQGEFRELLVDAGRELGSGVREFLQDNVAGTGRELLSSTIDATGVTLLDPIADPLLSVDYYAKSGEVLNGVMDAVVQPIGSISAPRVGPLLADPREELSAYLG